MITAQSLCSWPEATRLAALDRYGILDTPTEAAFDAIVRLLADLFDAPIAAVNLIAGDRQWFKAEIGLDVRQMPLDDSICKFALPGDSVMVVPDTTCDARFACNPLVTGKPGLRFYAGAPATAPFAPSTRADAWKSTRRARPCAWWASCSTSRARPRRRRTCVPANRRGAWANNATAPCSIRSTGVLHHRDDVRRWGTDADRARSADAGFDCHLTKPVELQAMLDIVAGRR